MWLRIKSRCHVDENVEITEAGGLNHIELTADLVSAYVANNHVRAADLPSLIATTYAALTGLTPISAPAAPTIEKPTPAQIKKSITPDALISFEDGKGYKTLRRHLTLRGLTAEAYRTKHGLPADYPMTAAAYSEQRSALAKSLGLGQQRRKTAVPKATPPEPTVTAPAAEGAPEKPKKPGRPRKAKEPAEA